MTRKQTLIKLIVVGLSLFTSVFGAIYILTWDIHSALYSVFWDYQFIRVYVLISVITFISLNVFRQFENLLVQSTRPTSNSNLGGLYSYLLGTIIYLIFLQFVFDFRLRVFGLAIPISMTTIGFNLNITKNDPKEMARKKVLIMANIVLLIFWSLTTIYLTINLEYKKSYIEEAKVNIEKIETQYLQQGDSLWSVFSSNKEFYDNKKLESIVLAQLKLHREFSQFLQTNDYIQQTHLDYLLDYIEMRTMMLFGLLMVILLNGLYLYYLIKG